MRRKSILVNIRIMNLNSKLKQGWLHKQLFCTTRNVNDVARIKTTSKNSLTCYRCHQKHVECQSARMKKDVQSVQDFLFFV